MTVSEHRADDAADLIARLATRIETELATAVAGRGQASLVVSGGRTPRPLLQRLAQCPLPWSRIYVTLADERWVDSTSEDSNEAMLRNTLLCGSASEARFVPLKNAAPDPGQGQANCDARLRDIPRPFDLVVLGMGDDGHTASLFPGVAGPALDPECEALCLPVYPQTAPHARMSLTAAAILDSRCIALHISGWEKWRIYRQAMEPGAVEQLPVRVVLHQDRVPVEVFWNP